MANTGSGIQPEHAGRALERFWRGDTARSDTGHHAGLGLTLCLEWAQLLGGSLTVSATDEGVFEVQLHLSAAPLPTDDVIPIAMHESATPVPA
jgi:signal transduction histidine kinase